MTAGSVSPIARPLSLASPVFSSRSSGALCRAKRGSRSEVGCLQGRRHHAEPELAGLEGRLDAADAGRAVGAAWRAACGGGRRRRPAPGRPARVRSGELGPGSHPRSCRSGGGVPGAAVRSVRATGRGGPSPGHGGLPAAAGRAAPAAGGPRLRAGRGRRVAARWCRPSTTPPWMATPCRPPTPRGAPVELEVLGVLAAGAAADGAGRAGPGPADHDRRADARTAPTPS